MNDNKERIPSVGVAIITYRDKHHLEHILPPLLKSPLKPSVLVFNSTSNDGTVEEAERLGAETLVVPRSRMNHGLAREMCRKELGTDIVVNMTPDAYPEDEHMLEKLIKPIVEGKASVAYARQLPKEDADVVARYSRKFNYPDKSHIRGIEDADKYGSYINFCSDACAAWSNKALGEIGGFRWVLAGEDAIATSMLLKRGHRVAYVAEARVYHSHSYGPKKEFFRHFDTGIYRRKWQKVLDFGSGGDQDRGMVYAKGLIKTTFNEEPLQTPRVIFQLGMGYLGYLIGRFAYKYVPNEIKKKISHSEFFWKSEDFAAGRWKTSAE